MIYLVRHGQSTSNIGMRTQGADSTILTDLGIRQAKDFAAKIDRKPDLIVVSPFIRTRLTAQPLIDKYPDVHVETWDVQEFTFLGLKKYDGTTQDERRAIAEEYFAKNDPDYCPEEDGESLNMMMQRIDTMFEKLSKFDQDKFIIVFTHGRFMRGVHLRLQNLTIDLKTLLSLPAVPNTGIIKL